MDSCSSKKVRVVVKKQMADLLEAEPKVAQELVEIIEKATIKELNEKIKQMAEKKKYKLGGQNKQTLVVHKA